MGRRISGSTGRFWWRNPLLWLASLVVIGQLAALPDFDRLVALAGQRYGADGTSAVEAWQRMVESAAPLSDQEKLERVNGFFNRIIQFVDDRNIWGVEDYWATPLESMGRRQGDCEDFSIAKYVTLGLLGVPIEKLRLTYVRAEFGLQGSGVGQAHMVLAYYPEPNAKDPEILDNLIGDIRKASRRPDLKPVFGFNSQGLWVAGRPNPVVADPTSRLSRWRDMLRRMSEDGLE